MGQICRASWKLCPKLGIEIAETEAKKAAFFFSKKDFFGWNSMTFISFGLIESPQIETIKRTTMNNSRRFIFVKILDKALIFNYLSNRSRSYFSIMPMSFSA